MIAHIWNKYAKTCLPFSLQRIESTFSASLKKYNYYHKIPFYHPENLGLALVIINAT